MKEIDMDKFKALMERAKTPMTEIERESDADLLIECARRASHSPTLSDAKCLFLALNAKLDKILEVLATLPKVN